MTRTTTRRAAEAAIQPIWTSLVVDDDTTECRWTRNWCRPDNEPADNVAKWIVIGVAFISLAENNHELEEGGRRRGGGAPKKKLCVVDLVVCAKKIWSSCVCQKERRTDSYHDPDRSLDRVASEFAGQEDPAIWVLHWSESGSAEQSDSHLSFIPCMYGSTDRSIKRAAGWPVGHAVVASCRKRPPIALTTIVALMFFINANMTYMWSLAVVVEYHVGRWW
jgi:hypothetical protein